MNLLQCFIIVQYVLCLQAEDGKTELSLIHFTKTNPKWRPPQEAEMFVNALKEQTRDATNILTVDTINAAVVPTAALYGENSLSSIGIGVSVFMKVPKHLFVIVS